MTRRVAAVDCGTNSLRLLVADVDVNGGEMTDVARRMEIVRLGQGVDRTGRLAPEALARTTGVLRDYADIIAGRGGRRGAHGGDQRDQGREQHGRLHPPGQGDTGGRAGGPHRI